MEFAFVVKAVWPILLAYGPAALGWLAAAALFWHILQKRKEVDEAINATNNRLLDAKDAYIDQIKVMNDKLAELNEKQIKLVNQLSEARIEDLKELTADYNKLANDTLRTMDRFVVALETSNTIKKSKGEG